MASDIDYMQYVAGQLASSGIISYKKMFGEYGVYLDGKYVALVCDNQFLLKSTTNGRSFLEERSMLTEQLPYIGATTPCFLIEDLDDVDFLREIMLITYDALPAPKLKKAKGV